MKSSVFRRVTALFAGSDEQAMTRVQRDDDAHAFSQLVRRWELPIQGLCSRMLGDPHRGQDLAQETFARLFAKRKDYQPTGKFSTFLWRIALNLCYDELRRMKRRPEAPLDLDQLEAAEAAPSFHSTAPGADTLLLQREQGDLVRSAVLQLSDVYRSVIVLRHYENLKFREIAEVLGIPEGTVKSRMAEALSQLHRSLAEIYNEKGSALCKTHPKRMEESLVL
jgi:RNA polymerase sigma-70 factor (ECF subfamily)